MTAQSTYRQDDFLRTLAKRNGYPSAKAAAKDLLGLSDKRLSKAWLDKREASDLINKLLKKQSS